MTQHLDSATRAYVITLIASPPTILPFEVFCQEAVARTAAVGAQFAAYPAASHYPAMRGSVAHTSYQIQVWDSSKPGVLGENVFSVQEPDPEKCLHELGRELAGLKAKLNYDSASSAPEPKEEGNEPEEKSCELEARDKGF